MSAERDSHASQRHSGGLEDTRIETATAVPEHLNIKVTDNQNEVFFKIKRSTKLEKLMAAFCERQGKAPSSVRFLFEGQRVQPEETPADVGSVINFAETISSPFLLTRKILPFSWRCLMATHWRYIRSNLGGQHHSNESTPLACLRQSINGLSK